MTKFSRSACLALLSGGLLLSGAAVAQASGQTAGGWDAQQNNPRQSNPDMLSSPARDQGAQVTLIDPGKIYNASSPTEWVGKDVTLKNVTVQDTNDTGNFWVGSDGDHRLLIVKEENNPNLHALTLHKGDVVTVSGVIHPASDYMASQTTASSGSMSDAKGSSGVFLLANRIEIASSTQH